MFIQYYSDKLWHYAYETELFVFDCHYNRMKNFQESTLAGDYFNITILANTQWKPVALNGVSSKSKQITNGKLL